MPVASLTTQMMPSIGAITREWCDKGTPRPDAYYGSCSLAEYAHLVRRLTFIQGYSSPSFVAYYSYPFRDVAISVY
jgi:hypothetical protein